MNILVFAAEQRRFTKQLCCCELPFLFLSLIIFYKFMLAFYVNVEERSLCQRYNEKSNGICVRDKKYLWHIQYLAIGFFVLSIL